MYTKAEQSKDAGNAAFRKSNFPLALAHYSTAIQLDPSVATYPLNRAAVHLKLGDFAAADKDATKALDLEGGVNPKALFRRGMARRGMGKKDAARKDFELAKQQGAGAEVDKELASLMEELKFKENQPPKKEEKPKDVKPASPAKPASPSQAATASTASASPTTERLRAALASPAKSPKATSPASSSAPSTASTPSTYDSSDLLRPVSSRRLTPAASSPPASTAAPAVEPVSTPALSAAVAPSGFAAKKSARDARQAQPFLRPSPSASPASSPLASSANPSPAPPSPSPSPLARAPPASPLPPPVPTASSPLPPTPAAASPAPAPAASLIPSPTALESLFLSTPPGHPSRLAALQALPTALDGPTSLRSWMGDGGLGPELLSLMLEELGRPSPASDGDGDKDGAEADWHWRYALLRALPTCKRWDSAVLFLSEAEREVVRGAVGRVEEEVRRVRGAWGI
ncbi:hypothetical protein JCM8097_001460 [Rhodosporidiobolus ruineniae]